jgi:hypothetical protein
MWRLRSVDIGSLIAAGAAEESAGSTRAPADEIPLGQAATPDRAAEIALAIGRASEFGLLRPKCLARSIALRDLLEKGGVHGSVIRVGVRNNGQGFQAHAWVECNELVLGDDARHVSSFTPLRSLGVRQYS